MRKLLLTNALLLAVSTLTAPTLVLWGLDNTANLTDPGTGAPRICNLIEWPARFAF
jgi:hypothetical protein